MKRTTKTLIGFVFVALLSIFAVALCGEALRGDPFAIALFVSEIVLVCYPLKFDETKQPQWINRLWTKLIYVWFACTFVWILYQLRLI